MAHIVCQYITCLRNYIKSRQSFSTVNTIIIFDRCYDFLILVRLTGPKYITMIYTQLKKLRNA